MAGIFACRCAKCRPLAPPIVLPRTGASMTKTEAPNPADERMGKQLMKRKGADALRGWRGAGLSVVGKTLRLGAINYGNGNFSVEAEAKCVREDRSDWTIWTQALPSPAPKGHEVPHPDCTCGFYATKERADADQWNVMLDVEVSGTVISHEKGYRASKQRVLQVIIPCCAYWMCRETSVVLDFGYRDEDEGPSGSEKFVPHCGEHARNDGFGLTLLQAAEHLGTEVVSEPWTP